MAALHFCGVIEKIKTKFYKFLVCNMLGVQISSDIAFSDMRAAVH